MKKTDSNPNEPELNLGGDPGTIVQENKYDAPVDKIWQSLTDPNHLNNWFGVDNTVTPGPGGTMRHSWGDPVVAESKIQTWEPNSRLKVLETTPFGSTFQPPDGPSKPRTIDYQLTPSGNQTSVKKTWSGFGTTPEWQRFQSASAGCGAFQASAVGHYAKGHFGEKRTVSWARMPSNKSFGEMWGQLTGPNGIISDGSLDGLETGDKYSFKTVTGDLFQGVVVSHIPYKQFAGTVENLNNSLLRIVLDRPGPNQAGIWLASWGEQPAANQTFEWRWIHALQKALM